MDSCRKIFGTASETPYAVGRTQSRPLGLFPFHKPGIRQSDTRNPG